MKKYAKLETLYRLPSTTFAKPIAVANLIQENQYG